MDLLLSSSEIDKKIGKKLVFEKYKISLPWSRWIRLFEGKSQERVHLETLYPCVIEPGRRASETTVISDDFSDG